ncbi:hypothetical protein A2999_01870 [Candidatus Wolfebacteria bacterium RIFCSPLOWO2_01_FULL_38_11]|uniref:Uncharacterized protein n=2 Tax=Candidatus Wolfeibacteriota TaxID=1752735 RepID=A0A0G0FVM4_9BACT|nr:MAG: hypothetical protein US36_C0005G0004 [Candidatus Wolfebacteria bacterium GW2011_GWC1_37_10]OGM90689.1 MAG: hypothetical protein A2999_01870 [Candidatus Wolfebacteria bacterium RIFCSPLOWO2_01_FULL_38_11]
MKRQLIIIISIAASVIFILSGALVYLKINISKKTDKITELRNELEINSQMSESFSLLYADINNVNPYLEKIDSALPSKDRLIKFSNDMKLLAASSSINYFSEFSGDGVDNSGLKWIGLKMSLEGDYDNIINFLRLLENSQYSVKLNVLDFVGKDNKFKLIMDGKVFYF